MTSEEVSAAVLVRPVADGWREPLVRERLASHPGRVRFAY
jgi:hypothetical protein